jgi:hypothetical protein
MKTESQIRAELKSLQRTDNDKHFILALRWVLEERIDWLAEE